MSELNSEINQIKQYLKHHRIATYATIAFLAVFTFITAAGFQSLNQSMSSVSQASGGKCPLNII